MRTLIPCFILILISLNAYADNLYFSKYTGFGDFDKCSDAKRVFENDLAPINNDSDLKFCLHQFPDDISSYVYEISLANASNVEGRKMKYKDADGNNMTSDIVIWGIVWAYTDRLNYHFLELNCDNRKLDDLYDQRTIHYRIGYKNNGSEAILNDGVLYDRINLYDGYSKYKIVCSKEGKLEILCGTCKYEPLYQYQFDFECQASFGCYAGPGVTLNINKAVLRYELYNRPEMSEYNAESLRIIFSESSDELEGYWIYLDRNLKYRNIKLGGKYRLAIVKDENGYLILYVGGQQRNSGVWQPYSIKGKLYATDFLDTYNLIWYDTLNSEISDDTYVQLKDKKILEVHFPIFESSMRFVKE